MIKCIFFDVGGVLIDHVFTYLFHEIVKNNDIDYYYFTDLIKADYNDTLNGKISETELFEKIIKQFNLKEDLSIINSEVDNLFIPLKTLEIVDKLKGNYKLGVISDMGRDWAKERVEKLDLNSRFEEIIFSSDVGVRKPNKKIFQYALNKFDFKPAECLFIDDQQKNIDGAKAVGMQGIVFESPQQLEEELIKLKVIL